MGIMGVITLGLVSFSLVVNFDVLVGRAMVDRTHLLNWWVVAAILAFVIDRGAAGYFRVKGIGRYKGWWK